MSRTHATDRAEAPPHKIPIHLSREPHQRMAWIDELLQRRLKQVVLTIVARLAHGLPPTANPAVAGNHAASKSGIPKRKKTSTRTQLSCKIEYLLRPNQPDRSSISEFFTGDSCRMGKRRAHGLSARRAYRAPLPTSL